MLYLCDEVSGLDVRKEVNFQPLQERDYWLFVREARKILRPWFLPGRIRPAVGNELITKEGGTAVLSEY